MAINLFTHLNVSSVTSLLADGQASLTPVKRIQGSDLPAITFERIANTPVQSLGGDTSNLDQARYRINCWAASFGTTRTIGAAVRAALGSDPNVVFVSDQDLYEDDTQIYRHVIDINIWGNPK